MVGVVAEVGEDVVADFEALGGREAGGEGGVC